MNTRLLWCPWSLNLAVRCGEDHVTGHPHRDVLSELGTEDEPRSSGALVIVWGGDYRQQEVWVSSGANIGNWYCLGGEGGRPKIWSPAPRRDFWHDTITPEERPAGSIPQQPTWADVLARGPVSLLTVGWGDAYRTGWRNGRMNLAGQVEELAYEDPPAGESSREAVAGD